MLPSCQSAPYSCYRRASLPALDIRLAATRRLPLAAVTGWQLAALELGSRQSSSPTVVHHFEKGIWQKVKKRFKKCKVLWQLVVEKRKKSTTDKYFVPRNTQGAQPSMRSVLARKEATWRANMAVGRFFYDACIPTNVDAKKEVQLLVDSYRAIWEKVGCTIMGDGWTDNRQRTLINFLVYCPERISFVKSVDASDIVKDASNLFLLFDEVIEWVGPLNVVHIVTDNAANYVVARRLISQKHKHINWSPCAAHCLNLIFKDIDKMNHVAELVRHASKVTIFVYNHVALLSWLRKRKGWTEILRPSATHFATTFIALKSLHDHKHDLQALVTSKFFVDSRYSKDNKSKVAVSIILDNRFWNDCLIVVNLMSPLMCLLRIVDCDERPSMGYVYEGMYRVRLGIKKLFNHNKRLYKPYTKIIKQRWDQQLQKSIHSTTYWFNPCFQYDQENFCNKPTVIGGVTGVIDQKILKGKLETMNEMKLFHDRLGSFGRDLTYSSREVLQPVDDDQPIELDVEELETLLYEEGLIPINEVEGSSSHVDNEDDGDMAIKELDVENFGFSDAYFQSPYSNFQNE
ncbi:hypothetical protein CK203_048307 [Vitis vinifera]|uniref:DUF659 domain-containing protein n=1 Tax=Vitis vinifera TaxID=29760 RepID=A0A438H0G2_VITVI|nr:hypothetical protein CK203_048307 [Vitis vinifera]